MNDNRPTFLYFPQWQGCGLTNAIQTGAETLRAAFSEAQPITIPLSDEPLTTCFGISGYQPLLTQLGKAQTILEQQQPARLLLVAGDCAAEIAPISYLNQRYEGDLLVLWLDAHADLNTPESSPSGHFHGMPLRLLLDGQFPATAFRAESPLTSQQVVFVGLRDTDPAEDRYIADHAIPVLATGSPLAEHLAPLLARAKARNIYIHLDLDVLNPQQFPDLQCPVAGGYLAEDIAQLLRHLLEVHHVVGMSLTETTATKPEDLAPIQPILALYRDWLLKPTIAAS
ncbi:arginase family protein [Hymenobacter terrenus]|uniref:arginase family protein n=1 Tax=Hymenobacter terrenus TaxID=1629124 RepID=UPI0006985552|nr:arginase family protein [Hymenobacter terrenus]